jgi:hypothetical protein
MALHYNALDKDGGIWGKDALFAQAAWLRDAAEIAEIASNKNHFTRWEGTVDFFRWLEEAGIGSDQSKAPSKKGDVGFLFGSCLPWRPLDLDNARFLDVIEIPLQTQDLWLTAPAAIAGPIVDQAIAHQGVAHFLFHQVHLLREPEVGAAFRDVVAAGRARGLEWWTGAEISAWTRQRRSIVVAGGPADEGRWRVRVTAPEPVSDLGILVILPERNATSAATASWSGGLLQTRRSVVHTLPALSIRWDHPGGEIEIDVVMT